MNDRLGWKSKADWKRLLAWKIVCPEAEAASNASTVDETTVLIVSGVDERRIAVVIGQYCLFIPSAGMSYASFLEHPTHERFR